MPASPLRPHQTLGIMGGGQLGRMSALAARRLGLKVHILDPDPACPAHAVADQHTVAPYDDVAAAERFAQGCDVVTYEFENVPAETLQAIDHTAPIRPSAHTLHTTRHRAREKQFLQSIGIPTAPFHVCTSADDVIAGVAELGTPCILKTCEFGYDGKGQVKLTDPAQTQEAWRQLQTPEAVLEGFVPFDKELSVIAARSVDGTVRCFDPVENIHTNHILDLTLAPARVPEAVAQRAIELATRIANELEIVGLIAAELFLVGDELVVNELAPRPHNSGHHTLDACPTSQFEQHVRAVAGLPLGDPRLHTPAVMANLLGDLWAQGEPAWANAFSMQGIHLHHYGKADARPARKMAHLNATAPSLDKALQQAQAARDSLTK